jgi:hypothetical protein
MNTASFPYQIRGLAYSSRDEIDISNHSPKSVRRQLFNRSGQIVNYAGETWCNGIWFYRNGSIDLTHSDNQRWLSPAKQEWI